MQTAEEKKKEKDDREKGMKAIFDDFNGKKLEPCADGKHNFGSTGQCACGWHRS